MGKGIAREGEALGAFNSFYADRGDVGCIGFSQTQHRYLTEHFVVDLGNEVVLITGILTPDLSELDRLDCQKFPPGMG